MATSKMQIEVGNLLDKEFPQFRIRENFRPDWFISSEGTRLELDFYIEDIKVAFEVQGEQHFSFIPFFHKNQKEFEKHIKFDKEKKELCAGYGIILYEICTKTDAIVAIKTIQDSFPDKPKYSYSYETVRKKGVNKEKLEKNFPNSEEKRKERLSMCQKKLSKFLSGEINASPELVSAWERVILLDGYEPDAGLKQ